MLTDSQLRSVKPPTQPQRLSDRGGLYPQIDPNGDRYWRYNHRFAGKQNTLALGVFPDVSLARAAGAPSDGEAATRRRHRSVRREAIIGRDLRGRGARMARALEGRANERHAHYVLKRLEADIFPEMGSRP